MKRLTLLTLAILLAACQSGISQNTEHPVRTPKTADQLTDFEVAYFASGCFWCVEAIFQSVIGVEEAISGYSGGERPNPTYRQVSAGITRHAEAVAVYYDPDVVSFETLLEVFFGSHDPTTVDRQGPDRGPQYRSAVFYRNAEEERLTKAYIAQLESGAYSKGQIVTEVSAFKAFYEAEDYHQEYEYLHPDQPYVRSVSIPRLNRFKARYPHLLKEEESH